MHINEYGQLDYSALSATNKRLLFQLHSFKK